MSRALYSDFKKGSGLPNGQSIRNLYNFIFDKKIILSGYRGSIAHNLHIPREKDDVFGIDDIDMFELYCYPPEYYFSLEGYYRNKEVKDEIQGDLDIVEYEIRKAFHLFADCNPNVLLFLYNTPKNYSSISEGGKLLLKHREIFLSKDKIKKVFSGYAHDQIKNILTNTYKGYMGERRKKLYDTFGFDTKKAMTAIRIIRQGSELLLSGELKVSRDEDRDFLLDIKKGKYTVDEVRKMAEEELKQIESSYKKSELPEKNNLTKINRLLVDIIRLENGLL